MSNVGFVTGEHRGHTIDSLAECTDFIIALVNGELVKISFGDPIHLPLEAADALADARGGGSGEQDKYRQRDGHEAQRRIHRSLPSTAIFVFRIEDVERASAGSRWATCNPHLRVEKTVAAGPELIRERKAMFARSRWRAEQR